MPLYVHLLYFTSLSDLFQIDRWFSFDLHKIIDVIKACCSTELAELAEVGKIMVCV